MDQLKAQWSDADVQATFLRLEQGSSKAFINAFAYIGETFINKARRQGTYTDRTGNLRSSVGYVILIDGKIYQGRFTGTAEGEADSIALALAIGGKLPGIVLICMAGMAYAAAVESKGYDVITGSTPTDNEIGNQLRTLCRAYLN